MTLAMAAKQRIGHSVVRGWSSPVNWRQVWFDAKALSLLVVDLWSSGLEQRGMLQA
jgi:hypothetical protein